MVSLIYSQIIKNKTYNPANEYYQVQYSRQVKVTTVLVKVTNMVFVNP